MKINVLLVFLSLAAGLSAQTQYDLLLKGGHLIDPKNEINRQMDVGISGDKIARVAPQIDSLQARKVVDCAGLYVTPGLVDIHVHVYAATARKENLHGDPSSFGAQGKLARRSTQVAPRRCGLVDPWTPAHCTQNAPWGARRRSAGNWATRRVSGRSRITHGHRRLGNVGKPFRGPPMANHSMLWSPESNGYPTSPNSKSASSISRPPVSTRC